MAAIAAGDHAALAALYDRHSGRLLGLARRILGDAAGAEDLLHDVFLEVWQHAAAYSPQRGTVSAWLIVRTRSRALDRLGRSARHAIAALRATEESTRPTHAETVADVVDLARLQQQVERLPPELVAVLELVYFEGLSASEVAERLRLPTGTVKSRLARALSVLRDAIHNRWEATS